MGHAFMTPKSRNPKGSQSACHGRVVIARDSNIFEVDILRYYSESEMEERLKDLMSGKSGNLLRCHDE